MADRVVPNSLNYTDIKPESIESEIKLVKFTPTSTVTGAKGGDMVKFLLTGNGFFDPYSSYFQFTVECENFATSLNVDSFDELRFVDRSAHSFIQRIIIRSQGVELERIENYDIIAAMINDMVYSPEQNAIHQWEGFPSQQVQTGQVTGSTLKSNALFGKVVLAQGDNNPEISSIGERRTLTQLIGNGASPCVSKYVGEVAFGTNKIYTDSSGTATRVHDDVFLEDTAAAADPSGVQSVYNDSPILSSLSPLHYASHDGGARVPTAYATTSVAHQFKVKLTQKMQFIIPIYSGVIGLLMPDKKLLPLNLLPLDIEIVFNNHALYSSKDTGSRNYKISQFNMYAHMIFFEQDIHRSLEAAVAEHGIFIYCNSFHSAPQTLIAGRVMPAVSHISMNLKSVNSVHTVFMYNNFETSACARKLHFVSHNLTSLQLLNGTTLIPQYAIQGHSGTSYDNSYTPFLVELMKAWNKMHDPKTDGAIQPYNFCGDDFGCQFDPVQSHSIGNQTSSGTTLTSILNKQGNVGRCQYGISLEGEELGTDKTMITGRKSQYPFLIQLSSAGKLASQTSYMFTFLRADFIVYIRPDLQIVTLGK